MRYYHWMAAYNPNGIWKSKEKEYSYTPPGDPTSYTDQQKVGPGSPSSPPPGGMPPDKPVTKGTEEPGFFKRHGLIFFTIGIVLLIALAAFVYYLLLPPATPNVVITFSQPSSVTIGEPFPLTVTVANDSKSVLQNVELNISLPNGLSFVGDDPSERSVTETVGTLSSQTINPPEAIQVIADPSVAGTSQTIAAQMTYQTAPTAATQFQNSANTSITIGSQSAISLSYNAPSSIFSGQDFAINITYENNTTGTLDGVQLGEAVRLSVHSKAYGKLLFAITLAGGAVLALLVGRRLYHRFRGQPDRADLDRPRHRLREDR